MRRLTRAITRLPGPDMGLGLTTAELGPPDYGLALRQHSKYVGALESAGLEVLVLPYIEGYPDAHFIEDAAVVTPDVAVIARPGAASRRGEEVSVEEVLRRYREVARIEPPGTLDGGDVLAVGSDFFIGLSARTNDEGARQLSAVLQRYGNTCRRVAVSRGLHLKSSVSHIGGRTLLLGPALAGAPEFAGLDTVPVVAEESRGASTLLINGTLMIPAGFPRTKAALLSRGFEPVELDVSEMQKMDGGLTCLSIRF
jgi:dimethylargininase